MTKEEKLDYINKRCETEDTCFGCPIWEYMKKNSKEGDLLICTDVDIDTAYELLMEHGSTKIVRVIRNLHDRLKTRRRLGK